MPQICKSPWITRRASVSIGMPSTNDRAGGQSHRIAQLIGQGSRHDAHRLVHREEEVGLVEHRDGRNLIVRDRAGDVEHGVGQRIVHPNRRRLDTGGPDRGRIVDRQRSKAAARLLPQREAHHGPDADQREANSDQREADAYKRGLVPPDQG